MRNSIILPKKYGKIFMIEARKSGLIKHDDNLVGIDAEFDSLWKYIENVEEKRYIRCYKTRQKLFQMILLYDEVIISETEPQCEYQYNDLKNSGNFAVYSYDDYYRYNPIVEDEHLWYAEYLKPAILPIVVKEMKKHFPSYNDARTFRSLISDIYDFVLGLTNKMDFNTYNIIEHNRKIFGLKDFCVPYDIQDAKFDPGMYDIIGNMYKALCWQIEISLKNDSYIINSEFNLSKIGCNIYSKDINTQLKAYEIIQLECSKVIENLPHMNNLNDVLALKERRKTDIKNLREVIYNLETIIKEQGTEKAVIQAAHDVQKAARSLSVGNEMSKVGKWLTLISVPVTIAELLCNIPPISSLLTIYGAGACLGEQFYKNKGGWCEVVR